MAIPAHIWFIWFGRSFPLFAELAVRSALLRNPEARVSVWHAAELQSDARIRLSSLPRVQLREIQIESLLERAAEVSQGAFGRALDIERLRRVWDVLTAPAARANLVRLLVLFTEGGVYLDTDTLTLRPFTKLLQLKGFCGVEHLLWPKRKLSIASAYFWLGGPLLMLGRVVLGKLPYGYRPQRRLLRWYSQAANNAVLGFMPRHPLVHHALERITQLDELEWSKRFRLGTHLLQESLEQTAYDPDCSVARLSPTHFYPLGPVISQHYFRDYADAAQVCSEIVSADTYVIHWYASVSDLQAIDASYIRAHRTTSVFATLCAPVLDALIE